MARKSYQELQPSNWYMRLGYYKKYMLRELTAIPTALAALNLFWGIGSLAGSLESFKSWCSFNSSAIMVIFNLIVIVAAVFNSNEWFKAIPAAIRIQVGTKFVEESTWKKITWGIFGGVFLILLIVAAVAS